MFAYSIIREIEKLIYPWLKLNNKSKKEQLSINDIEEELIMIKLNFLKIGKHHEEIMVTEFRSLQKEIFTQLSIKPELIDL